MITPAMKSALESAERNNGVLTRLSTGSWMGAKDDKFRHESQAVARLVKEKLMAYSRKMQIAGVEVAVEATKL